MMAYYDTCPECGANLDPGEKCDCQHIMRDVEVAVPYGLKKCDCRRSEGYQYKEKERAAKADTPSKNTSIVLLNCENVKWSCK